MDAVLYDLVSKKNWVCEEFLVSGNFTAKSDIIFTTACAGGGGGHATGTGGAAGEGCEWLALPVTKGATYAVSIGAGGAVGGAGGNTRFGSLLTLYGGSAGVSTTGNNVALGGGRNSGPSDLTQFNADAVTMGCIVKGASIVYSTAIPFSFVGSGRFKSNSGAGGMFGEGGTANNAAADNSGAGGGTNAAGGSGKLMVYYYK